MFSGEAQRKGRQGPLLLLEWTCQGCFTERGVNANDGLHRGPGLFRPDAASARDLSPRGAPGGRSLPPSSPPAPQRVQVPVDRVAAVNFTVAEPREQKFD